MYFTPALLITRDGTSTVYPGADGHFLVTRYLKTLPVFPDLLELKIPNQVTAKTLESTDYGQDLHRVDSVDELFRELDS